MDDITDTLAAYAQVCELSNGVRDIMRAARADIIDLRQRFKVVEEKYFGVLKHWNEACADIAKLEAAHGQNMREIDRLRADLAAERERNAAPSEYDLAILAERATLRAELAAAREALVKQSGELTDKCNALNAERFWREKATAQLAAERETVAAYITSSAKCEGELMAANEALLTAEMMLSELGISASEKCQMAYDHLHRYRTSDE